MPNQTTLFQGLGIPWEHIHLYSDILDFQSLVQPLPKTKTRQCFMYTTYIRVDEHFVSVAFRFDQLQHRMEQFKITQPSRLVIEHLHLSIQSNALEYITTRLAQHVIEGITLRLLPQIMLYLQRYNDTT